MSVSINGYSATLAQSLSSVSHLQQQQFAKALESTAQVAPAASAPIVHVGKPHGSLGHNIDVTA
ncbi:hypothetical protein [Candidatus Methylospira mobilis]|uniref:hypothetical protein n=1 Tax=Candidatus Methylospira mobilis TaxID=1808979 RepID=UPI001884A9AD|nr:hypothetical protein [Candidatus Methylospira mobilis]